MKIPADELQLPGRAALIHPASGIGRAAEADDHAFATGGLSPSLGTINGSPT